jgi:uncharacterized protein (TIGR02231 family)
MKKILIPLILMVFCLSSIRAEETQKPVDSKIKQVTVFRSGAQVTRTGTVSLPAGNLVLLLADLPERLNPQSIQVNGKGKFTILSVQHQVNYLKSQEKSQVILDLEKKLQGLKDKLSLEESMLTVYQSEEAMIMANKSIGGTQNGVDVLKLKDAADFFRTRLTDLQGKKLEQANRINSLKEEIQKVTNQLNMEGSARNKPTSEILITVTVPAPVQADLEISYLVTDAGWYPGYDIRAEDITKPIEMHYKANVFQSSGETWNNVKLTLSTGNPQLSGVKPDLKPWYLRYYEPQVYYNLQESAKGRAVAADMARPAAAEEVMAKEEATTSAQLTTVSEGQTSVEFQISIPYTIQPDGKSQSVEIQQFSSAATYEYHAVPKLDRDAFLLARITGWEQYNLLPGEINLFFEGTYVGKSFLDPASISDTLNLSLGRDKDIVVTRTAVKDYHKKQLIGPKKSDSRGFDIEVRNSKNSNVKLVLEDQFPLSTNKDIEVERNEVSGGKVNNNTGIVTWEFDLKPSESRKVKIAYTVKYPKDQTIILE